MLRIAPDGTTEVVLDSLPAAGGIAFDQSGNLYVVTGALSFGPPDAPPQGQVLRCEGMAGAAGEATPAASPMAGAGPIEIAVFAFMPASLEMPSGATVTWLNRDQAPHTATGDKGEFDTGRIESGQSETATFDTPGSYAYHCDVHPNMMAVITVT